MLLIQSTKNEWSFLSYDEIIIHHSPGQSVNPGNAGNGVSESSISKISRGGRGGIPQTPLEAHVFGTPVRAFSTHVHLFHLGILYSKMLPKTLYAS